MSNVGNLKSLLNKTKDYIISTIFPVFLTNNTYDDANIYELSLLIKYLLIMAPDQIFPYIKSIYVPSLSPSSHPDPQHAVDGCSQPSDLRHPGFVVELSREARQSTG